MEKFQEKHGDKLRYLIVGGFNTFLDFAILFGLVALGIDKIPANYISTTITMIISFFLNKEFTFKSEDKASKRQFIIFIGVTAAGLWIIQPIIILIATSSLNGTGLTDPSILFISKVIATCASLVWNYLLYSRLVFLKEAN